MTRLQLVTLFALALMGLTVCSAAPASTLPASDLLLSSNGGVADVNHSTLGYDGSSPSTNLNDGNPDGLYGDGSVAHSQLNVFGAGSEMEVTLPSAAAFGSVQIYNRTDPCCGGRIDGSGNVPFTLNIFNGASLVYTNNYTFVTDPTLFPSDSTVNGTTINLPSTVTGNIVQIVQNYADYMNIAELAAFAPVPEPATIGLLGLGLAGLLATRRGRRS